MVKQLTTFIRGSNGGVFKSVAPEFLLTEVGSMMRSGFPKNITVTIRTLPGTSKVRCDATQIRQVLLKLCANARDALPNGGEIHLTAQNARFIDGDFVCIEVRDNGPGIPEEIVDKIWSPFFTTKNVNEGTGLGLTMSKSITLNHGGDIVVQTCQEGTSFRVYLPVAKEETRVETLHRIEEFDGAGKTVLVVEDEAAMRVVLQLHLSDANYKAIIAGSAFEALRYFHSNEPSHALLRD